MIDLYFLKFYQADSSCHLMSVRTLSDLNFCILSLKFEYSSSEELLYMPAKFTKVNDCNSLFDTISYSQSIFSDPNPLSVIINVRFFIFGSANTCWRAWYDEKGATYVAWAILLHQEQHMKKIGNMRQANINVQNTQQKL